MAKPPRKVAGGGSEDTQEREEQGGFYGGCAPGRRRLQRQPPELGDRQAPPRPGRDGSRRTGGAGKACSPQPGPCRPPAGKSPARRGERVRGCPAAASHAAAGGRDKASVRLCGSTRGVVLSGEQGVGSQPFCLPSRSTLTLAVLVRTCPHCHKRLIGVWPLP